MTTLTWKTLPATGDWNTADNWTPSGLPTETAAFSTTSQTAITFSATGDAMVECIEFADNAPTYTFIFGSSSTAALTITGQGVFNHSNKQQSFVVTAISSGHQEPQLKFINSATAGGDDMYYCSGPETEKGYGGGVISFCNHSTAGSASFKVWIRAAKPPQHSTVGGEVSFSDSTSADMARFTIYGTLGTDGDTFGNVVFHDTATAANASFINCGSTIENKSSAGHTIFAVSLPIEHNYYPNAGDGTFWNHPGFSKAGAAGFTEFAVHSSKTTASSITDDSKKGGKYPTAGSATFINLGAYISKTAGGYTVSSGKSTAENATLIAYGGTNDGYGGRIVFYDTSSGGTAKVQLFGNGKLDISDHTKGVTIAALDLNGGIIGIALGSNVARLTVTGDLSINSSLANFSFRKEDNDGFAFNTLYTILTSVNLASFAPNQFNGNCIEGVEPSFAIVGKDLQVSFLQK